MILQKEKKAMHHRNVVVQPCKMYSVFQEYSPTVLTISFFTMKQSIHLSSCLIVLSAVVQTVNVNYY